jgi:hypothetical protein
MMHWEKQKEKVERETHLTDVTQHECELATMMSNDDTRVHSTHDWWNIFVTSIEIIRRQNL